MKKLSKILCAVLVLAMLCSSLVFVAGAEEAGSDYTSVAADGAAIVAAIKYEADDNLFAGASLSTNTEGWNTEKGPQAHVVTDNKTGETYFHQFVNEGGFVLKEGSADGNEYINFTFNQVNLKHEAGYNEYVIVEYEVAHKAVSGAYAVTDGEKTAQPLKQEVIVRGSSAGTSWATVQKFSELATEEFAHVTTVYDYTSGNAYSFINGVLSATYTNGALSASVHPTYVAGEALTVSEWRIGSNSYDDIKLDNVYIRYQKLADADNTIDDAIKSGKLSDWDGNVYVGFVPSASVAPHETASDFSSYISGDEDNIIKSATYINQGSDYFAEVVTPTDGGNYLRFTTMTNGVPENHFQVVMFAEDDSHFPVKYDANNSQYVVYDIDIATETDLTHLGIIGNTRNGSGMQGKDPGGASNNFTMTLLSGLKGGEFHHLTIVVDYNNNLLYIFLNNKYVVSNKLIDSSAHSSWLAGSTAWEQKDGNGNVTGTYDMSGLYSGFKFQAHSSYKSNGELATPTIAGETVLLDNLKARYIDSSSAGTLAAALTAKDLGAWDGAEYGEDYEFTKVAPIGTVNGTEYGSTTEMAKAIAACGKKACTIEFLRVPVTPVNVKANATVNTNGMPIESLVIFDEACSTPIVDGNLYTVTLGWSANYSVKNPGEVTFLDLAQVKYEDSGNILGKVQLYNYQHGDQRNVSYITNLDTGDVFVNDYPVGNITSASNTYFEILANPAHIDYKKGVGQTFVYDFDMAVYDREAGSISLISRYGTSDGAWGQDGINTDQLFADADLGKFYHVTIVVAVDSRTGYYFLNNELVHVNNNVLTEKAEWLNALRCFGNSTADVLYDNFCVRQINNPEIETIAAAGNLSGWSAAIYGADYKLPTAPTVVTIDGVDFGSVEEANKVLAEDNGETKLVEIKHVPFKGAERIFKIRTAAEVNTNGLDVSLDWNTGVYEFDPNNDLYESTETGLAYASSKLIHTSVDNIHYFTTIDASNCFQTATPVNWYYDDTYANYDVVFYVFGDTIAPLEYKAYVEDGVYFQDQWQEFTVENGTPVMGEIVEEYPVSSATTGEKNYLYELVTKEVDFIATDIKLGAVVNSNIELTVYVNKYQTLTTGDVVVLDGVEYVALRFELAPHEIDKLVEAEFIITDDEGNEYPQLQRVSFLDYAEDVLSGDYTDADKKVVANLLAYANEASVLFNGEKIAEVTALLETYASYVGSAELGEKADTSALSSVIRSAALRLNGTPEFVFKVARGTKGTITFTYQGVTGPVEVKVNVDATAGEQLVSLPVDVCDLQADITITYGEVSGTYNLATYAQSLENNGFAVALYNYSVAAKAHKTGLVFVYVITGYDADNNPITEIYGEYTPGSKIDIPFLRDGLTLTWYLGDGEDKVAIDINDYVITESITLSYSEVVNTTPLETVTDEALKAINASKLKNFDSYSFVTAVKDGKPVEAIRLTRTTTWPESNDIESFWTEQSYTLDSSRKVISLSFDYLVLGELGRHQAKSGRSYGTGIFYVKYTDAVVAEEGLTDSLKEVDSGTLFEANGQWNTVTYVASEVLELDSFIINLYKLEGDVLITNIVVEYAPYETYNEDGSLNTTVVLKENVESETLTTIVDKKIKQCDQANPGTDPTTDKFAEGGTAAYVYAVKDGEHVEGLYFSRSVEWLGTEAAHFTEFRFAVNNEQAGAIVTSISFDYIVNGTVEENTRYQFTDLDGTKFYADAYVQIKTPTDHPVAGDKYPELQGTDLVLDGEWHTMNIDLGEGVEIIDILLNLYQFQGEMVISNLVIEYAE
ncbi:MAG: hypothetical protein IJW53_04190 [Clostridia bacterium]|nr:hypothetical protein [Clostridia bacterium]